MKIKNRYKLQKNISFILLLCTGFLYLVLIIVFFEKSFPGFVMQILYLTDNLEHGYDNTNLITSTSFILGIFSGILSIYLIAKFILATLSLIFSAISSYLYIKALNKEENGRFILISSESNLAFTFGFLKPKVYISHKLIAELSVDELESIISHEYSHVASYDPLRKLYIEFLKNLIPFLYNKKYILLNFNTLSELSADYSYISSNNSKLNLLRALNKTLQLGDTHIKFNVSKFVNIPSRIKLLIENRNIEVKRFFFAIALNNIIILFILFYINQTALFIVCANFQECVDSVLYQSTTSKVITKDCLSSSFYSSRYHCSVFDKNDSFL